MNIGEPNMSRDTNFAPNQEGGNSEKIDPRDEFRRGGRGYELAKKEFDGVEMSEEEKHELVAWRDFPHIQAGSLRDMVIAEQNGTILPSDVKILGIRRGAKGRNRTPDETKELERLEALAIQEWEEREQENNK